MMRGIPPEVKLFLRMKNKTEEMMGYSSGSQTDFDMENKTEKEIVDEMLGQISRLSPQSINHIGVWCLDLLRNRLELSLKELNKKD